MKRCSKDVTTLKTNHTNQISKAKLIKYSRTGTVKVECNLASYGEKPLVLPKPKPIKRDKVKSKRTAIKNRRIKSNNR